MKTKKNRLLPRDQARELMKQLPTADYLRVSTEAQALKYGPDSQRQDIADAIASLRLQTPRFTFEDHISAKGEVTRTDFERAIAYAVEGRYRLLLVGRIDRFARNEQQGWNYLDELVSGGAYVYFIDEDVCAGLDEDWHDAVSGEISRAAAWSRKISKNVRKANRQRRQRGEWIGQVPWGTRKNATGGLDWDPAVTPTLVAAKDAVLRNDKRLSAIADNLTLAGHRNAKGGRITKRQLYDILTNPILIGTWRSGGDVKSSADYEERPNMMPALIEVSEFNRMQEIFAGRSGRNGKKRHVQLKYIYVLREALRCGKAMSDGSVCGATVRGQTRFRRSDGYQYVEYLHHDERGCHDAVGIKRICFSEDDLLEQLDHVFAHIELGPDALALIERHICESSGQQGPTIAEHVTRLRSRLALAHVSLRAGGYGDDPVIAERDFNRDRYAIEDEIAHLEAEAARMPSITEAAAVLQLRDVWAGADRDERRRLIEMIFDRIEVVRVEDERPCADGQPRRKERSVITRIVPRARFREVLACALADAMSGCACSPVHSAHIDGLAEFVAWRDQELGRAA